MFVILDRDGVINHDSEEYIKSPEEWLPIAGSLEAIARLNQADIQVFVATNQSGVNRGYYDEATLEDIHNKMHEALKTVGGHIDGLYYCPHHPDENCSCRKPRTQMLEKIARDFNVDLHDAIFIGDSWRDMEAAMAVGAKPVLVMTGNGEDTLHSIEDLREVTVYSNLSEVVDDILSER